MSDNLFRYRGLLVAVLGTGIFIGATGLFIILRIIQKNRKSLKQKPSTFNLTVDEIEEEITALRDSSILNRSTLSLSSRSSRVRRNATETDDEMYSAIGSESDEYFDLTSDEEEITERSIREKESEANNDEALELFKELDLLMRGKDEDRWNALKLLQDEELKYSNNSDFLWRMAKAHQLQASACAARNDKLEKRNYVFKGLVYAEKALAIDPANPDAHKWYAILIGMQGEFLSVKEKISSGHAFQKHLTEALKSKPNDATLHHLLARFKFEIANLSWVEKKMASTLFGELPHVTMDDAVHDFLQAEELSTIPWKENRLLIAKCYIAKENYPEAIRWLNHALEVKPVANDDITCDVECNALLKKYEKYAIS